jgi:hypothetical protein
VKPCLFYIDNTYYSVYGDSSVIRHFSSDIWKDQLIAIAPSGNILFAANKERLPTLQSCGVDNNNIIWVADVEGNIVFFDTYKNIYMPYVARCADSRKLRIPRENLSTSVFAYDITQNVFIEYTIIPSATDNEIVSDIQEKQAILSYSPRKIPSETVQILLCDTDRIVYVTDKFAAIEFRDTSKNIKVPILLDDNELLTEGVFDEKNNKVYLLIRKKAKNEKNVFQVRDTWNKMRLLVVNLKSQEV